MKRLVAVILTVMMILLTGCRPVEPENIPYEPNTPAPDPHIGIFDSDYGTMMFNGDGESIVIDFSKELAEMTGLPEGETEGKYVFLSGDLPPHGSVDVRYDVAHELEITVNDKKIVLELGIASRDGKSAQSGVDTVTENRIPVLLHKDGKMMTVIFEKKQR
ncbi:MAG: hypothetical protein IIY33_00445 [Erysipelotrichaceae bacterium]|nr:hypothetical protein [Erysipelotrichaceae bacterium]